MAKIRKNFLLILGGKVFWAGLSLLGMAAAIAIFETAFYLDARPVDARVLATESICRFGIEGDELDCSVAKSAVMLRPDLADDLKEYPRTLLLYVDPAGQRQQTRSPHRFTIDGRPVRTGDTLRVVVDAEDYSDVRPPFDITRYGLFGWLALGGIACTVVGLRLRRLGARMLLSKLRDELEAAGFGTSSGSKGDSDDRATPGRYPEESVVQRMR